MVRTPLGAAVALDRSRVLETAQKHLAKGQYDRAIAEYHKLVQADPSDVRTWLKIGDLYTRKGDRPQACTTYQRVAQQYADQGFFLKAVAVYKQILKLEPSRLEVSLALAGMYEHLQLVSDALATYEHVAAGYARQGDIDRALDTLRRMADLDPENIPVRIKYAEALSKAGRTHDAANAFQIGADLLRDQGRLDDFMKVAERLLYHRPTDVALARDLAELYLERADPKRALSKLQLCFKADPRHIGTLTLLARAFQTLGQLPKTISVFKEVARIHQEANRPEERAIVLKQILELDPNDLESRQALASFAPASSSRRAPSQLTPPPSAVVATPEEDSEPELEVLDDDDAILLADEGDEDLYDDLEEATDHERVDQFHNAPPYPSEDAFREEPSVEIEVEAPSEPPAKVPSIPPDVAREAQIARLLTECDVFQRYGLRAKVLDQLRRVLEIAPDHVEARERLKDQLIEQGKLDEAIEQLYTLASLFEADKPQVAHLYLKGVLEISPMHEPARARVAARSRPPPGSDNDVLFVDEPDDTTNQTHALPDHEAFPAHYAVPPPAHPDHAPSADSEPPTGEAAIAPMSPEEFESAPLRRTTPGEEAAAIKRASLPPGEIEEILEEAEFYLTQGLLDEASSTLREALLHHPDHPLIVDKLTEVAELTADQEVAAHAADTTGQDDSFLLAEKLAEELAEEPEGTEAGSDVLDVETVFAQFKKGVEEQIGLEDSDTHFDLGIAYKEMGLLDDAIHEFNLARSNPQRECIAFTMIGLCHVEKGEIAEAIANFKKGLYADNKTDREELGLYFELGIAYELMHDPKEALFYYQKVQKRDPTFRNVEGKVRNLTRRSTAPANERHDVDDVDRAFDDLLGDD